jgi:cell cycle checkpoint control protein RAD9A
VKSYKLTYEPVSVQHAVFDRSRVKNEWKVESKFLREIIDHFSPSAEQLDIYPEGGKAVFTSFTTKVTDGKGWLVATLYYCFCLYEADWFP